MKESPHSTNQSLYLTTKHTCHTNIGGCLVLFAVVLAGSNACNDSLSVKIGSDDFDDGTRLLQNISRMIYEYVVEN